MLFRSKGQIEIVKENDMDKKNQEDFQSEIKPLETKKRKSFMKKTQLKDLL